MVGKKRGNNKVKFHFFPFPLQISYPKVKLNYYKSFFPAEKKGKKISEILEKISNDKK